ncbi:hypothetical protein GYMLUDRAFT_46125 [Collybiopsis luxurians FD-317 M1]|uniref:NB-ARC domain-containing protein n=1 Tax=Collybiopsis luxurians FD-317 M1 TaxID=944289 RepID=A0A0D0CQ82_9AGAR|nr:hypothetical protein GYMLUDRAFT_46125 [Collybiopsis luxurians FD-317 M1]
MAQKTSKLLGFTRKRFDENLGLGLDAPFSQHSKQSTGSSYISGSFFAGARDFRVQGGEFYHIEKQYVTLGQNVDSAQAASDILICPVPSQYFVGRKDILSQLSRVFSAPVATLYCAKKEELQNFIKHHMKWCNPITLDATSATALEKTFAEEVKNSQSIFLDTVLVLENTDPSVTIQDYLPGWLYVPILITSTSQNISNKAFSVNFQLFDSANQKEIKELAEEIKKVLQPQQHIVTLVASGGTGKTQVVLKFVSENSFRFSNVWFFDATSDTTLVDNFRQLGRAAGVGEQVEDVKNFLVRSHQNWLCIFDNADEISLKSYIPICNHGNVIVTSRLKESEQLASPGGNMNFGDIDRNNAIDF